jgi:hypothetical protein
VEKNLWRKKIFSPDFSEDWDFGFFSILRPLVVLNTTVQRPYAKTEPTVQCRTKPIPSYGFSVRTIKCWM